VQAQNKKELARRRATRDARTVRVFKTYEVITS
jgi:hypothetical protein